MEEKLHVFKNLENPEGCLTNLGYGLEFIPSPHPNRLTVEMKGREIFRCDIRNLYFNIDCEDDPVCQRLISAVEEAKDRMYDLNNLPKFRSIKDGKRVFQAQKEPEPTQKLFKSDVQLIFEIPKKEINAEKVEQANADAENYATENDEDVVDDNDKNDKSVGFSNILTSLRLSAERKGGEDNNDKNNKDAENDKPSDLSSMLRSLGLPGAKQDDTVNTKEDDETVDDNDKNDNEDANDNKDNTDDDEISTKKLFLSEEDEDNCSRVDDALQDIDIVKNNDTNDDNNNNNGDENNENKNYGDDNEDEN